MMISSNVGGDISEKANQQNEVSRRNPKVHLKIMILSNQPNLLTVYSYSESVATGFSVGIKF